MTAVASHTVTAFVNLLAVLEQNAGTSWRQLLEQIHVSADTNPDLAPLDEDEPEPSAPSNITTESAADDDLAAFKL